MKKDTKITILKIFTIISGVLLVITTMGIALFRKYMFHRFVRTLGGAKSVGIIGGADGPTAIFVATKVGVGMIPIVLLIMTLVGCGMLFVATRSKKK